MERDKRPWWLTGNSQFRAAGLSLAFLVQFGVVVFNAGRKPVPPILIVLWLAFLVVMVSCTVATIVTFHRHPDWVKKEWPRGRASRQLTLRTLRVVLVIGLVTTVAGVIVAAITGSPIAAVVAMIALFLAFGAWLAAAEVKDPRRETARSSPEPLDDRS